MTSALYTIWNSVAKISILVRAMFPLVIETHIETDRHTERAICFLISTDFANQFRKKMLFDNTFKYYISIIVYYKMGSDLSLNGTIFIFLETSENVEPKLKL